MFSLFLFDSCHFLNFHGFFSKFYVIFYDILVSFRFNILYLCFTYDFLICHDVVYFDMLLLKIHKILYKYQIISFVIFIWFMLFLKITWFVFLIFCQMTLFLDYLLCNNITMIMTSTSESLFFFSLNLMSLFSFSHWTLWSLHHHKQMYHRKNYKFTRLIGLFFTPTPP